MNLHDLVTNLRLDLLGSLLVAVALSNVLTGLVVLTSRLKALTQVVGYLMLENGIYVFGLTQTQRVPFLLEMGVLLDVFVGVFIMGIVVFHINREFDTVGSDAGETLDEVFATLTGRTNAVVVARDGKPVGVLTRSDLLDFLAHNRAG